MLVRRCSLSRLDRSAAASSLLRASAAPQFLHFLAFVCFAGANHSLFLFALERLFCDFPP